MSGRRLQAIVGVVLAGLWGAFLAAPHLRGEPWLLDRMEATTVDLRTVLRGVREPPSTLLIVAIDDEMATQEGAYPISRATLARIVDAVAALGPKVVALDILLLDPGEEDGDRALAASLARNRSLVAAAAVFGEQRQNAPPASGSAFDGVPVADALVLPLDRFAEAAAVGVVNVATDSSGSPRLAPLIFRSGERVEASFALQAASLALDAAPVFEDGSVAIGDRVVRTDLGQRLPISYYGPRGTIATVGAAAVLAGRLTEEQVAGKIVVIGATVIGSGDVYPTPFDAVLPGVEVVSTAIAHLTGGGGMVRDQRTRLADAVIAVLLPMSVVALLAWRRSLLGLAALALLATLWLAAETILFAQGIWLSAALPIAATVPPAMLFGASQIWLDRRRAQRFAQQNALLRRFQAPALRDWLARNPDFLAIPVRQEASIVFIDLSGFTGFSEIAAAGVMRDLLDDFYRLVEQEAEPRKGIITSFMGDGAMIVFGLPRPTPDDPANALACATALARRSRDWLAGQPAAQAASIGIKLGAHCGSIVASRLGGGSQQTITATGDTVNVASRLMEVAARNGAELALSGELYRAAGQNPLEGGTLQGPAETAIRGRSGMMTVWFWRCG
ncbi:CHASE2 domain-containing protein [Mesorhizobium sp. ZMM04-5]|uniref:CHASE2 domain-containing protein n=1 Tax=Mesorhizobium marinum TaxID=3228790 RepID=A0ABV3QUW1_9HYPH